MLPNLVSVTNHKMKRALFLSLLLLLPFTAFAGGLVPSYCQAGCPCTLCDLYTLGHNIVDFLFQIAASIAVLMIFWGGFLILTSRGNPGQIDKGKKALANTVIGALIAFLAWLGISALLNTIGFGLNAANFNDIFNPPDCANEGGSCNTTFVGRPDLPSVFDDPLLPESAYIPGKMQDGYGVTSDQQQDLLNSNTSWDQNPNGSATAGDLCPYASAINGAAGGGLSPERIAAIIMAESSGRPAVGHTDRDGGSSY